MATRWPSVGIAVTPGSGDGRARGIARRLVRGHTLVAAARLDNEINVRIASPVQPGRRTVLKDNTFAHGRPTAILLTHAQLEREFGRR